MIKLQTFPVTEFKEANEFMLTHAPRSTEKQSGIVFHNGHIVIIYDDGIENKNELKAKIITEIEGDRSKSMLIRHSKSQAESALEEEEKILKKIAPKGFRRDMKDSELRVILKSPGIDYVDNKLIEKFKEDISMPLQRIVNLENEILMDTHEERRLELSITGWQKLLTQYE